MTPAITTVPENTRHAAGVGDKVLGFAARAHGLHQAAVFRIGLACTVGAFLLREWPNRRLLWGDRAPWALDMADRMLARSHGFTVLTWWDGRWWPELVYHGTLLAAFLLALGWRTRATSVVFMVGVLSLVNRNTLVTDGGDNIVQIMVIYLAFTRCGHVWSLDARRRSATGPGRPSRGDMRWWQVGGTALALFFGIPRTGWTVVLWAFWACQGLWMLTGRRRFAAARPHLNAMAAMIHNAAMVVIAVQVCFVYATAGWYKIQGITWENGTALYYPLHMGGFTPWPSLSHLLASSMTAVTLLSYGTVILQVSFPFLVLHRRAKNLLLPVLILEHLGIAVVMGLPFLSAIAIVCDTVFLPTAFLQRAQQACSSAIRRHANPLQNGNRSPGTFLPWPRTTPHRITTATPHDPIATRGPSLPTKP